MKVVILAGGYGTRISEESRFKPKPMIEIGNRPILWHIMRLYSNYGFNEFVICLGYKGHLIKEYFKSYYLRESDVMFDYSDKDIQVVYQTRVEPWKITLVDTGENVMTGGRIKRVQPFIGDEPFMLTYGDGLADIDLSELYKFHREHGKLATVTAVQPEGRFGALVLTEDSMVSRFKEKPKGDGAWVNGGFFVLQPQVFDYIDGDESVFEAEPLRYLSLNGQLMAYKHKGFWQSMDTLWEKNILEELWSSGKAPWKIW